MIKIVRLTFLLIIQINAIGFGQTDPFTGPSGVIKRNYDFNNFSKISLIDIDGKIEIEVGDSFKIELRIREKYLPIFLINESNNHLELKFNYTKDNNKYINDPQISIKIACPNLEALNKIGNGSVSVGLKNQNSFSVVNEGNGNASLKGTVNELKIKNNGNGKTDASRLNADYVEVESSGNGNIIINANKKADGIRKGNGKIIQKGNGILKLS
jgi:hypothetical protein